MWAWGAEYTERMTQSIRWLQEEIAQRMLQKLEIVKLQPKDILLIPDFAGGFGTLLKNRFPKASLHGAISESSLMESLRMKFLRKSAYLIKQDQSVALLTDSQDLIFSTLWLQDLVDPRKAISLFWNTLREEGLLTLSYLGPDTGKELKAVQMPAEIQLSNLSSPWDMHDFGDALLGQGFSDPVMDMEFLTLEYESNNLLLKDAAALGLIKRQNTKDISEEHFPANFPKKLTLEVVYGHAWALGKHLSRGNKDNREVSISIDQIKRK